MERQNVALELPRLPVFGLGSVGFHNRGSAPNVMQSRPHLLTTSARAAFLHGLAALGVGRGDRVMVPTYHCPTMVSPIIRLGAEPVFYPIDRTGLPATAFLESVDTSRVKAMLAAHFFGLPLRLQEIRRYCNARGIALVEDCAHAFFGHVDNQPVGHVGDLAIASLPKFFPVSEGGCLVASESALSRVQLAAAPIARELRSVVDAAEMGARFSRMGPLNGLLRSVFSVKNRLRGQALSVSSVDDDWDAPDVSKQHDPWLEDAVIGRRATRVTAWLMRHADHVGLVRARRRNYALLSELMSGSQLLRPLFPSLPEGAAPYVFPLEVDRPDPLYSKVRAAGIPVFRWDRLWPGTPALHADCGTTWAHHVFQIGCHQDLDAENIRAIALALRRLADEALW